MLHYLLQFFQRHEEGSNDHFQQEDIGGKGTLFQMRKIKAGREQERQRTKRQSAFQ